MCGKFGLPVLRRGVWWGRGWWEVGGGRGKGRKVGGVRGGVVLKMEVAAKGQGGGCGGGAAAMKVEKSHVSLVGAGEAEQCTNPDGEPTHPFSELWSAVLPLKSPRC